MGDLQNVVQELGRASIGIELLVLSGCIALAYALAKFSARGRTGDSVLFGRRTVDGLLFPLLALILIFAARHGVAHFQPVVVLTVALPIFTSLVVIRLFVRVLSTSFPRSASLRRTEQLLSWLAWGVAVLWLTGLLPAVLSELESISLSFGKTRLNLRTLLEGALSSGVVLVGALWIAAAIEQRVLPGTVADLSMRKVAGNAIRALLLMLGLLFALSAVGVDLTALSVLGGALGVGLGFGLQKLAANYVSGFVILLERSLRIGDLVRVEDFEGVVTDIKTRYTLIRSFGGREAVVPNEQIITQRIENLSLADPKVLVKLNVSVGYDSDVARVREILLAAANASDRVLRDPPASAYLANFGADGLDFTLVVWIADPQSGQLSLRSEINERILQGLRDAGIEIPYPQRVVHMKS